MTNNKFKKISTSFCVKQVLCFCVTRERREFLYQDILNYIYIQCADTEMKKLKSKINRGYN